MFSRRVAAPPIAVEAQCARCGGDQANVVTRLTDSNGRFVSKGGEGGVIWGVGSLVLSAVLLNSLLPALLGESSALVQALPAWLPIPIAAATMLFAELRRVSRMRTASLVRYFRCKSCNFRWNSQGNS